MWDVLPAKRPVLDAVRRIGSPPESIYRHLHFKGVFTILGGLAPIRLRSHGNVIENELFWRGLHGGWEGTSLRLWEELARGASVVLDVGANSGIYALAAQAANPHAVVVAFEPVQRIYDRLKDNVALNGDSVRCVEGAVSDTTGFATLFEPPEEHPLSATVDREIFVEEGQGEWREVRVRCLRLDEYLTEAGLIPDLIKIDVEGHERAVIDGLGTMLEGTRPTVVAEVLTSQHAVDLTAQFQGLGYDVFRIEEGVGLCQWEPGGVSFQPSNFLFCSPTVTAQLGAFP